MYHRFSNDGNTYKTQQSVFENQIKVFLKKFNFIRLKHYCDILRGERNDCPNNSIILTFDDGYQDNYTFAYPILKKYSIPATIFLVTDFISHKAWLWSNKLGYILRNSKFKSFEIALGGKIAQFRIESFINRQKATLEIFDYCTSISDDRKKQVLIDLAKLLKVYVPDQTVDDHLPLTWEQIKEMNSNGIEFGGHSCSHAILNKVSPEQLEHEIFDCKREIESKLGVEVTSFCYPNGCFNYEVLKMTQNADYLCGITTKRGFNDTKNTNRYLLKRSSVFKDNKAYLMRELCRIKL